MGINSSRLSKGDWIRPEKLENLFGYTRMTSSYRYHRHMLIERIQEETNAGGVPLLCRPYLDGIRVLTDPEALVYKQRQHRRCVKKLGKVCRELHRIDSSALNRAEKKVFRTECGLQKSIFEGTMDAIRTAFSIG